MTLCEPLTQALADHLAGVNLSDPRAIDAALESYCGWHGEGSRHALRTHRDAAIEMARERIGAQTRRAA